MYEDGGFFLPHRDTEKVDGMFGTLVIVLPSAHRGGELLIRHPGREVTLDLSNAEVSELTFAAFYADCEHEVKPVAQGSRVCLTYNLIQRRTGKKDKPLTAPLYDSEVEAAAALLERAFGKPGEPSKLVWLLEHQYSPAGLSFSGLKGQDAALAKVLRRAAARAECAMHLGIVHIEESGAAEPYFDEDYGKGRRSRRYDDMDEEIEEEDDDESASSDFEVIEVVDGSCYVDQWVDTEEREMDFGPLPIEEGEVLPAGALDDEVPDQQRLTEATGNEGASFERSYHRAALVVWPRNRFVEVLLEAGPGAPLAYFGDRVQSCRGSSVSSADREAVSLIGRRIVEVWEAWGDGSHPGRHKEPDRSVMIALAGQLADERSECKPDRAQLSGHVPLLERFVGGVVTREYDGTENEALAANAPLLGPQKSGQLFTRLANENMRLFPGACADLLKRLIGRVPATAEWIAAFRDIGAAIVEALPKLEHKRPSYPDANWRRAQKMTPVDAGMLADLLDSLAALNSVHLRDAACTAIAANPAVFKSDTVIVPAIDLLHRRGAEAAIRDRELRRLWCHAAEFLLARSEYPPELPKDWQQSVTISCRCDDCCELQAFARNPDEQTHRFRVRKDRRQHLHQQIEHHNLDISHAAERIGSPQTLVCAKTRRTYERQCRQHEADLAAMSALLRFMDGTGGEIAPVAARIQAATTRHVTARSQAV